MKLETQNSYISNPQLTGGAAVTPISGSAFASAVILLNLDMWLVDYM